MRDEQLSRTASLARRLDVAERHLEETQALTRVGSWEWALPERRTIWSKEQLRLFGRDPTEPPPSIEEVLAVVHPDDRDGVRRLLDKLQAGPGTFDHDYRVVDGDGEVRHQRARGRTLVDERGRPFRAYGTTQDVSELKRSERSLEETQSLARVGSWEWTIGESADDWRPTWSRQMQLIFGRDPDGPPPTREELVAAVHPEDRRAFADLIVKVQSTPGPFEHSYRILNASGRVRHMQARGYVEVDANGRPARMHGTTQDITELKESQAQLERARRLEAVGQLAGGVAHDFNNLLSVILNYAECMGEETEDPEIAKGLREIERAALTGADLTRRLLLFSCRDAQEPRTVDLGAAVADTEELLRRTIGDHIALEVDAPSALPQVTLGDGELAQILLNLVVNARDALPRGGTISVSVRELRAGSAASAPIPNLTPTTSHLVLSVADDGVGMSEGVAAQAFDPFFTTKPRGQGTGLGLATVYGIAARVGGHVRIESEPERGTAVYVYLPVTAEADEEAPPERRRKEPSWPAGNARSVLVVDNEPAVRTIVSRMLAKRGFRVQLASSGSEAEAMVNGSEEGIDLLITDVLMPGMSGRELVGRLRACRPRLRAIYMSGYAGDHASPLGPWEDGVAILQKPFTGEQLARAVGQALAER